MGVKAQQTNFYRHGAPCHVCAALPDLRNTATPRAPPFAAFWSPSRSRRPEVAEGLARPEDPLAVLAEGRGVGARRIQLFIVGALLPAERIVEIVQDIGTVRRHGLQPHRVEPSRMVGRIAREVLDLRSPRARAGIIGGVVVCHDRAGETVADQLQAVQSALA